ncbi:MAG TPA: peptidase, partial [Sulfitobacter sp.]|nr:peptidase [Sulfitobacter sp.]
MPRIKFADVRFTDPNAPSVFDIEHRLKQHLINFRENV